MTAQMTTFTLMMIFNSLNRPDYYCTTFFCFVLHDLFSLLSNTEIGDRDCFEVCITYNLIDKWLIIWSLLWKIGLLMAFWQRSLNLFSILKMNPFQVICKNFDECNFFTHQLKLQYITHKSVSIRIIPVQVSRIRIYYHKHSINHLRE